LVKLIINALEFELFLCQNLKTFKTLKIKVMKKVTIVILVLLISTFSLNAQVFATKQSACNAAINIYPNPSSNEIDIKASKNDPSLALDLYDQYGQKVFSKKIHGNTEKIAASGLATGSYIIVISSKENIIRKQKIQID
jgi:hypothetical protein